MNWTNRMETMMGPQLPRHTDLLTSRRYGYIEENIKDNLDVKTDPRPTRSEDLYKSRRCGFVEAATEDYWDVKLDPRPTRSEDLHKSRRHGYVEAETEERRPSPVISNSKWLQAHKRYGSVEKDQTGDIFSRENREDRLKPGQIVKIIDKLIDVIISRENKTDHQTNKAMTETKEETMMIKQSSRPLNARSEDLHTRRRYGYVEQGNEEHLDVTTKPRPSRSEDLHKTRRCGYVEEDIEDEILSRENRKYHQTSQQIQEILDELIDGVFSRESRPDHQTNIENPEITEATSRPSIKYLIWKGKYFEHFHYVYNLVRDCKTRVEKLLSENDLAYPMPKDVIVKIGIVCDYTKENVNLISKRPGKSQLSEKQNTWKALPLVCFECEPSSKSKLTKNALRQEKASHKIFIRSNTFCDNKEEDEDRDDKSIISVGQDKDEIEEIITSCLEEPLHEMLQKWSEDLKRVCFTENASDVIAEIEALRNKLLPTISKKTDVPCTGTGTIVPDNVKDYLFRRPDVNSFGVWSNSSFKVFVKKTTDEKELRDELMMLNETFLQKYQLKIGIKRWSEMQTMMQGDSIHSKDDLAGTLGGFVTKTNDDQKIYALTCNHLFPRKNLPAYINNFGEIGACVFTTRDKGCDFAAIEVKESCLDICDVALRRDDKKKTNAKVYSNSLEFENIVHKIGATTDVTNGRILSPEFYLKVTEKCNRENIFLVKGTAGNFSEEGDSGSLVFSRPNRIQQNYVNVVGMVYANDLTLYDDDEDEDAEDQSKISKCSQEEGTRNNEVNVENKPSLIKFDTPDKENKNASGVEQDTKGISLCCRIHTALELFKENQGDDLEVKFKNDLSSSLPLSSSSSESEDSNEENN